MMKRKAVFLDRDGTIIEDAGYIGDPAKVLLRPGAAAAVHRVNQAGLLAIVVSNQSGVARGVFSETDLTAVHDRFEALLSHHGAKLDAAYYCPYLEGPDAKVTAYRKPSELRKPRPGMLLQAAGEHDIDLAQSWMIGDATRDVEAGARAGCRTILLNGGSEKVSIGVASETLVAADLAEAVDLILQDQSPKLHVEKTDHQRPLDTVPSADFETETLVLLREIRDQLDRANRRTRQHDFSILRLFGSLLQMFAVVAAIWGLLALTSENGVAAAARLLLACFFQMASLSSFAYDKFR